MTGAIPPELGGLSNLRSCGWGSTACNQLTGAIPPELGGLSNLTNNNQLPELGQSTTS